MWPKVTFWGVTDTKWQSLSPDYCSEPHRQQIVINRISIAQPSPEILTESVRSATYIWRYVAKNDFYRQNAFFFIFDME